MFSSPDVYLLLAKLVKKVDEIFGRFVSGKPGNAVHVVLRTFSLQLES